ncbi:HD-GYP domain-containing protein [Carboxydothermus pertinax]|uniref:HD-GYP domain-containing protein n=1 Tax=Carboxydothermus pertinax TaxID=870242 RepID=A0A1L8CW77_9THEO|nr:HD domain-containing phosphohydrolase [Carboxydothermus pertinax]GAV23147.1 hypothetical protein cpu_16570 [Carboxydothermus pertinax]
MALSINVASLAFSLNRTFGLYEKQDRLHLLRRTFIALQLGRKLQLSKEEMENLFLYSLVDEEHLLFKDRKVMGQIFEIIFLAEKVADKLRRRKVCIFTKNKIKKYLIDEYKEMGTVCALLELMEKEAFWFNLEEEFLFLDILKLTMGWEKLNILAEEELKRVNVLIAKLIDNKDLLTRRHSQRVAKLAVKISEELKLSKEQISKIEFASILHDIGKLAIPTKILNKPGKLTEVEFLLMKSHPFYTFKLFEDIGGLEDICKWAGYHHEKLDGSGYPFKVNEKDLDLEARIIQVADITAAVMEKRSYRNPMNVAQVIEILETDVQNHKIDGDIVRITEKILKEREEIQLY